MHYHSLITYTHSAFDHDPFYTGVGLLVAASLASACEPPFQQVGNSCFWLGDEIKRHPGSFLYCSNVRPDLGTFLAEPKTAEEVGFLVQLVNDAGVSLAFIQT